MLGDGFNGILAAARAGESRGFDRIYRNMFPEVLNYFSGKATGSEEDLAAEVFMAVVERLRHFEGDERAFRSWVFTIAHHQLVDHYRLSSKRRTTPLDLASVAEHGKHGDVEEEAMASLSARDTAAMIARLPAGQSEVVLLRSLAGLTYDEIGRVVGKRSNAVRAAHCRAVKGLARHFATSRSGLGGHHGRSCPSPEPEESVR